MATRRDLLVGGSIAVAGYFGLRFGLPAMLGLAEPQFEFQPIDGVDGFRRLPAGQLSGAGAVFAGLSTPDPRVQAAMPAVAADPCAALHGPDPIPGGIVPVASFSDYNCPYCRILTPRLARMEADPDVGIQVSWHELPLLGESSILGARAAIAAKRQGNYLGFHERVMATRFEPTPDYVAEVADLVGLQSGLLLFEMNGDAVLDEIARSEALGKLLGLIGTPALVVGRTVVLGAIDEGRLNRLIARERADGRVVCG